MTSNRPKRRHDAEVKGVGQPANGRWKASCPCGWTSVERRKRVFAEDDAARHVERARGA